MPLLVNAFDGDGSDYSHSVHTLDLTAFVRELGLAPAHAAISSYGGDLARLLARVQRALVRTLLLGEPLLTPPA